MVEQIIPKSFREALNHLNQKNFRVIAGGTDLMIQKRSSADTPPRFNENMLYVFNLTELKYIYDTKEALHIGAMTPLEDILDHDLTPPLLKAVILEMASPGLRYVATLAGNIGNASPAGDSLVPLYLMDAVIVLESVNGIRKLPINDVIIGPRATCIHKNEMIKEIIMPHVEFSKTRWDKVGGRKADAITKVSCAAAIVIKKDKVIDLRFALGSIYKTVIRSKMIEAQFIGFTVSQLKQSIHQVIDAYDALIDPIDDQRSTKVYRRKVAQNLIKNFIETL